jgi:stage V sporulation protein SpoVS
MELLFQAWDELDDALAAVRHVLARYARSEIYAVTAGITAFRRAVRAALIARRRHARMRPARAA